jgi:hypothetical protein
LKEYDQREELYKILREEEEKLGYKVIRGWLRKDEKVKRSRTL